MTKDYADILEYLDKHGDNHPAKQTAIAIRALIAERDWLRQEMRTLYRGYVNTMASGRDRIIQLGPEWTRQGR